MRGKAAKILPGSFEPQPRRASLGDEPEPYSRPGKIIPGEFFRNKPEPMVWVMLCSCLGFTVTLILTLTGVLPPR